ncbi:hypothetical protein V1512DRAFT_256350 [Lipomyces arxii]|uniref:uncharacterized protein n=1 Tax=Lipomyces arxii TaxID=56418 RepID=UPI0034CEF275
MSGGPVSVGKKYSLRSTGIWERIRKFLAVAPNRSTGNPIVPLYRVPSTASRPEAKTYSDPVTLPASDIAGNPYHKRDMRRAYPRIASYDQSDISGLLLLGSITTPRIAKGEAGQKALTTVSELNLVDTLQSTPKELINSEILKDGLPPFPGEFKVNNWKMLTERESGMYSDKYPVRTFT